MLRVPPGFPAVPGAPQARLARPRQDKRFFLKTQTKQEMRFLLANLPRYLRHLEAFPHSLLVRLLGEGGQGGIGETWGGFGGAHGARPRCPQHRRAPPEEGRCPRRSPALSPALLHRHAERLLPR